MITSSEHDKKVRVDGATFLYAGAISDVEKAIAAYLSDTETDAQVEMFVVKEGAVTLVGFDAGKMFEDTVEYGEHCALGSGRKYAIAAMDVGATAKEAVKIAAGRDVYTGGKIRTLRVK